MPCPRYICLVRNAFTTRALSCIWQGPTCEGLLVCAGVVEVALGHVGAPDAHLTHLAWRQGLIDAVQDGHLQTVALLTNHF